MSVEELQQKIRQLEEKLAVYEQQDVTSGLKRTKIDVMSSEVVDSNPYRLTYFFFITYSFKKYLL